MSPSAAPVRRSGSTARRSARCRGALPPQSPKPVLEAYRVAYRQLMQDADFLDRGKKMSDDIEPMSSLEVESLLNTLGSTPSEAIDYISTMLSKQGLSAQ